MDFTGGFVIGLIVGGSIIAAMFHLTDKKAAQPQQLGGHAWKLVSYSVYGNPKYSCQLCHAFVTKGENVIPCRYASK